MAGLVLSCCCDRALACTEHELQMKELELFCSEEIEKAYEAAEEEKAEALAAAVAQERASLTEAHRAELEKAQAALAELEALRIKAAELERTITRLSPRASPRA
jgi:hypothetical protein